MYKRTEAYVADFELSLPRQATKGSAKPNQYLMVSHMANRGDQIIVGLRQDGITMGALMGMKYLMDIEELNVVMVCRNNTMQRVIQGDAENVLGWMGHNIITEHIGMIDKLAEYDVVIVDGFFYSRFQEVYRDLLALEKPPKVIFTCCMDNKHALTRVSTFGGRFDLLALVNDGSKWNYLEEVLKGSSPEQHERDFFNTWVSQPTEELSRKEQNKLGIREPGETGDYKDVK